MSAPAFFAAQVPLLPAAETLASMPSSRNALRTRGRRSLQLSRGGSSNAPRRRRSVSVSARWSSKVAALLLRAGGIRTRPGIGATPLQARDGSSRTCCSSHAGTHMPVDACEVIRWAGVEATDPLRVRSPKSDYGLCDGHRPLGASKDVPGPRTLRNAEQTAPAEHPIPSQLV